MPTISAALTVSVIGSSLSHFCFPRTICATHVLYISIDLLTKLSSGFISTCRLLNDQCLNIVC
uniref:Secreted protein n=1 Tax=Haemonchus placei TaxID=6290 RepID=A0A0N4W1R7_HAEPC